MSNLEMIEELHDMLTNEEIDPEFCPCCIKKDYSRGGDIQIGMDKEDPEFCTRCFVMNLWLHSDGEDLTEDQEETLESLWIKHTI